MADEAIKEIVEHEEEEEAKSRSHCQIRLG